MDVLAIAFMCVWISVALYVGWLGRQQRRLASRLEELTFRVVEQLPIDRKPDRKTEKAA